MRVIKVGRRMWVKLGLIKIFSWNLRGLGSREKRTTIRDVLIKNDLDIVILQKTKKENITCRMIGSV